MKHIIKIIIALFVGATLHAAGDLHLFEVDNANGAITPQTIEESFHKNGYITGIRSEMTTPFKKQFGQSDFKVFTLLTVMHSKLDNELVNKFPHAGVFIPMGVGIYQNNGEKILHVSILTSEAQAKIIGIDNNDILKEKEKLAIKAIKEALPNAKQIVSEDSLKENRELVTLYELKLDGNNWKDAKGQLEMSLEGGFVPRGFVMAASTDYDASIFQDGNNPYDFYESYSICKLPVIYTVAKSRPEAAAFAPCTTIVYKKKDENKIVIGFPAVYNWMSSARVDDKDAKTSLQKAQDEFEDILKEVTE
jgi:uncharacterized protein (DUF302 family)